jgi:WD40 repeat protein
LWDLSDRLSPRRLGPARTAGNGGITSLAFTPAGTVLAAGGTDGTVVLLDLAEVFAVRDGATERACAYASGGFDRDDWATYVPDLPYVATCPR